MTQIIFALFDANTSIEGVLAPSSQKYRNVIFWIHLCTGLVYGGIIAVLCFTGTMLALEKPLINWAENDVRQLDTYVEAGRRMPFVDLQNRVRANVPTAKPERVIISKDPGAAVAFLSGSFGGYYVDPYTGAVTQPRSTTMARFMQTMHEWHTSLAFSSPAKGRIVTGLANVALLLMAISGLYLWLPRQWNWQSVRPYLWFHPEYVSPKSRDYNWHNVVGVWCAPVLIFLTLTAVPLSIKWVGKLAYGSTSAEIPTSSLPPFSHLPIAQLPPPPLGARALTADTLMAKARELVPDWETITFDLPWPGPNTPATKPIIFQITEEHALPRAAQTFLQFDPYTGQLLRRDSHADLSFAQRLLSWVRQLHTGEAWGGAYPFLLGAASLGALALIYTGFALAVRRFLIPEKTVDSTPLR